MDFDQLLQRAATNQVAAQRTYERQRVAKEDERKQLELKGEELRRKAATHLKQVKERAHKEKMKYKGLVNPTPRNCKPFPQVRPSPVTITPSPDPKPHPPYQSSNKSSRDKQHSSNRTSKSPAPSSPKTTLSHKQATSTNTNTKKGKHKQISIHQQIKGSDLKVPQGAKKKSRSLSPLMVSASKRPPTASTSSKLKTSSKPSANFKDLMKLAQQNSTADSRTPSRPQEVKSKGLSSSGPSSRDSSPLGKSLVERSRASHSATVQAKIAKEKSVNKLTDNVKSHSRSEKDGSSSGRKKVGVQQVGKLPITTSSELIRRPLRELGDTPTSRKGVGPNLGKVNVRIPASASILNSKDRSLQKVQRVSKQSGVKKGARATDFYGAAAARILNQNRKSQASSFSGQYRSTWVDEMTDYLQSGSAYCDDDDEEEEEDDLDGFVASDEEFSDQEADYSSEIRKIFGYDKSRFGDYVDDDDVAMESSYAQQQYEEMRSARIGQLEDDEDLARERTHLKRKKQHQHKPTFKQKKLF